MKQSWVFLAAGLALTANLSAVTENAEPHDRSYQVIVDRNPFNLKPLPPPVQPAGPTNANAKGSLKLTGFTTLREKRAFFVLIDEKTKTNQPISLTIDQEVDGLRLIDIDPVFRKVRVVKDGVEKLMAFDTDGITNVVAVAMPGTPNLPGLQPGGTPMINRPGMPVPVPTVTPGAIKAGGISPNATTPGFRAIPSRNLRTSTGSYAQPQPQPIYAGAGAGGAEATRFLSVNGGSSSLPVKPAPQPDADAAQQIILMEAQRALNPNLPPTPGLPTGP